MASPSFFICILLHINYKLFFFFLQYFLAKLFNFFIIHSKKTGSSVKFPVFLLFYSLVTFLNSQTTNPSTTRIITSCHAYAKRMNTAPKRNSGVSGGIRHASTTQPTNIQNAFIISLLFFSKSFW